jgi:GrpB-like predicted nucleotidyltransferase (UPF0157 family)
LSELFNILPTPPQFDEERARVLAFVKQAVPDAIVEEVGSTAIRGLLGKQDIDIAVLTSKETFDAIRRRLDSIFERDADQFSDSVYQAYLVKSFLDVKIQATVRGGPHDTFDEFLEALRTEPRLVDAYNQLKLHWHGRPMHEYREAKASFIRETIAQFKGQQ